MTLQFPIPQFTGQAVRYDDETWVWDGVGWHKDRVATRLGQTLTRAALATLHYVVPATTREVSLGTPDLLGATYALSIVPPTEELEVHLNGVLLVPDDGTGTLGDYIVDSDANHVIFSSDLRPSDVVSIGILMSPTKLAPGTVNIFDLLDFDVAWADPLQPNGMIDGQRTEFDMLYIDNAGVQQFAVVGSAGQIALYIDGVRQRPGLDYFISGSRIRLTVAPTADSVIWAQWYQPGGAGGGVNPPQPPLDGLLDGYMWLPGKGFTWIDRREEYRVVADLITRDALRNPEEIKVGTLVYVEDQHRVYQFNGTDWIEFYTVPPKTDILQKLTFDPEKPVGDRLEWRDDRQDMEVVDTPADLNDRVLLPVSHMARGKLVFVRSEGLIYELIADPGLMQGTIDDWKPMVSAVTYVGRSGNLPPRAVDGQIFVVRMDFAGKDLYRLVSWDAGAPGASITPKNQLGPVNNEAELDAAITPIPGATLVVGDYAWVQTGFTPVAGPLAGTALTAGQTLMWTGDPAMGVAGWSVVTGPTPPAALTLPGGTWRTLDRESWVNALATDPPQATDARPGDFQSTVENLHKDLKVFDPVSKAWVTLFNEDDIREWIAALSLFQGTVQEPGGTGTNVPDFTVLPDLVAQTTAGNTGLVAHYWTFTGTAGYVIKATDPVVGTDLKDTILQPGDWLQVANIAPAGQPINLRWVRVGGDLLAKSRGDLLYGLQTWVAGGWERGSLTVFQGDVYRATRDTTSADLDPTKTGAPWAKIDISGGLKVATDDTQLPTTAPAGQVWIVLQSAKAGGKQALYAYDAGAQRWQELGGGGIPLELDGGTELVGVGLPVGAIIAWCSWTLPSGYLLCDGGDIPAQYKELIYWCGPKTPDLRDQFIRGAKSQAEITGHTKHPDTTRAPRNTPFKAVSAGAHKHSINTDMTGSDESGSGYVTVGGSRQGGMIWGDGRDNFLQIAGAHEHSVSGGDAETAPTHVRMCYVIKACDRFVRGRQQ